jgi:O-antigen/teichoic acid export membrane protein
LTGLIIGKMFSPADLAYYNRGEHFPNFVVNNINSSIQSVMLPSLSAHQDDKPQMKRLMRRAIKTSSFVIIPLMTGLAVLAKPVVLLLLGEKWLPSVPFIQVYCFIYLLYPIHTSNLSAINAMGRSDIFLKLEIIKKCVGLTFLIGGLYYFKSPIGIAYGASISTLINAFVNANPNKKLMGYGYFEQIKDIFPSFFIAAPMGACVYAVGLLNLPILPGLCLQTLCGIIFYFSLAKIFKLESFDYLLNTVKEFRNGRK